MEVNLQDTILYVVGVVVSLLFSYVPKLKDWYEAQHGYKALIMVGLIAIVSAAFFGLSCTTLAAALGIQVACTSEGALAVALAFIKIIIANQAAYLLTRK